MAFLELTENRGIRFRDYAQLARSAQRDHSKLQRPPTMPAPRERHVGCRDQRAAAGAICSRRDACVQLEPPEGGSAAEPCA